MQSGATIKAVERQLGLWLGKLGSKRVGISLPTIKRVESGQGDPVSKRNAIDTCAKHLNPLAIEFIDENGGGPGVRLRKRQQSKKAK